MVSFSTTRLATLVGLTLLFVGVVAARAQAVAISEFKVDLRAGALPAGISSGPDGNVWFTDQGCRHVAPDARPGPLAGSCAIGRITPSGQIVEYSAGLVAGSVPQGIAAGPDGNLWFTTVDPAAIGRITPSGAIIEYTAGLQPGSSPRAIVAGPDGALWFTDQACASFHGTCALGRITRAGAITEYPTGTDQLGGLTAAPDSNLWVSQITGSPAEILRVSTAGTIVPFRTGSGTYPTWGYASGIVTGPDRALWFAYQSTTNTIGRMTLSGRLSVFGGAVHSLPSALATGADGNVWFTDTECGAFDPGGPCAIGRVTPGGVITEIEAGNRFLVPDEIASGPDGALWFTDQGCYDWISETRVQLPSGCAIARVMLQEPPIVTAPAVGRVRRHRATVTAEVNPVGAAVRRIEVSSSIRGHRRRTVRAFPRMLPPGGRPVAVRAVLGRLPAGTTVRFRLIARGVWGTTSTRQQRFTTRGRR